MLLLLIPRNIIFGHNSFSHTHSINSTFLHFCQILFFCFNQNYFFCNLLLSHSSSHNFQRRRLRHNFAGTIYSNIFLASLLSSSHRRQRLAIPGRRTSDDTIFCMHMNIMRIQNSRTFRQTMYFGCRIFSLYVDIELMLCFARNPSVGGGGGASYFGGQLQDHF